MFINRWKFRRRQATRRNRRLVANRQRTHMTEQLEARTAPGSMLFDVLAVVGHPIATAQQAKMLSTIQSSSVAANALGAVQMKSEGPSPSAKARTYHVQPERQDAPMEVQRIKETAPRSGRSAQPRTVRSDEEANRVDTQTAQSGAQKSERDPDELELEAAAHEYLVSSGLDDGLEELFGDDSSSRHTGGGLESVSQLGSFSSGSGGGSSQPPMSQLSSGAGLEKVFSGGLGEKRDHSHSSTALASSFGAANPIFSSALSAGSQSSFTVDATTAVADQPAVSAVSSINADDTHDLTGGSTARDADANAVSSARRFRTLSLGFQDGLADWNITEIGGSPQGYGTVTEGSATLREGDSFLVALDKEVTIPQQPLTVSFTYEAFFDTSDPDAINDAFEAALVDGAGEPLVYTFTSERDAFFNVTEDMPSVLGRGTVEDALETGHEVSLDISHLAAGTEATIVFRLVNNDADEETTVRLSEVEITSGPDDPPVVTVELANDTAPVGPDIDAYLHDKLTNDPTLQGTASDDGAVEKLELRIDDEPYADITSSLENGQYSYDPGNLAPGSHRATIRATDDLAESTLASVDFVINSPPTPDAGGDREVDEGTTVSFDASGSTDANGAIYSYSWAFESGATHAAPSVSHTYADNGEYLATLTVTDTAGSQATQSVTVTVENLPIEITPVDNQQTLEGQTVSFSTAFADPGIADTHTATVNWGNGGPVEAATIDEQDGSGTVSGAHVYMDDGTYDVTLTVVDNDGAARTTQFEVTVANQPPDVLTASDLTGNEGQELDFVGTFSDPGVLDTHNAVVFWSDGSSTVGTVVEINGSGTVTATHSFADNGVYPVSLVVTDNAGDSDSRDATATVVNDPPSVTAANDLSVEEGEVLSLDVATFTDPGFTSEAAGTAETFTAMIDWGDGTPFEDGAVAVVPGSVGVPTSGTVSGTHDYADDGEYIVTVKVRDDDMPAGLWSEGSFTVTVNNVAPAIEAASDRAIDEGSSLSLEVATFTDPGFTRASAGTAETFTATIAWGNGTPDEPGDVSVVQGSAGVLTYGSVAGEHVYTDDGDYTVTVAVADDDQGVISTTFDVHVNNVAPHVEAMDDITGEEGQTVDFAAAFTDPGVLDTHTAEIEWGDGTSSVGHVNATDGHATVSGSHVYSDNGYYTVVISVMDNVGAVGTTEGTAIIDNVAPSLSIGGPQVGNVGEVLHFTVSATDPSAADMQSDFTYEVDWDADSNVDHIAVGPATGLEMDHIFQMPGDRAIIVTATDKDGGTGPAAEHVVTIMEDSGACIGGYVYVDVNNNGIKDAAEMVLPNVPITMRGHSSKTVLTDANGWYEFADLPPGTCSIHETQPAAFSDGKDTPGTPLVGKVGDDVFYDIQLESGMEATDYNFGEWGLIPELVSKQLLLASTPDGDELMAEVVALNGNAWFTFSANTDGELDVRVGSEVVDPQLELYTDEMTPIALSSGDYVLIGNVAESESYVLHVAGNALGKDLIAQLSITARQPVPEPGSSAWDVSALDVNKDGWISPIDALLIIGELNAERGNDSVLTSGSTYYDLDVNGDGHLSPMDALLVIAYLNNSSRAEGEGEMFAEEGESVADVADAVVSSTSPATTQAEVNPAETKFYVVDSAAAATFGYAEDGRENGQFTMTGTVHDPRGITSTVAGDKVWIIDAVNQCVSVFDEAGIGLGQWHAEGLQQPEGVATDGADIWIVDAGLGLVLSFAAGARLTAGSVSASGSFKLHADNTSPTGIATDGSVLWVADNIVDQVFVYDVAGTHLGRWDLDAQNADASGITIDPSGGRDMWVVDRCDLVVYHYPMATVLHDGKKTAEDTFTLSSANGRPEGIADPPLDSSGTDFWLIFADNYSPFSQPPERTLYITSQYGTRGRVEIAGLGFTTEFLVAANEITTVPIPGVAAVGGYSDEVRDKGIHVTAEDEITVYGLNHLDHTSDAFLALPTETLGTEYITVNYKRARKTRTTSPFPSNFAVVGTEDETTVTITPSIYVGGREPGKPYNVPLQQGEVYQLLDHGPCDYGLTGSIITSNKPVATFSAHTLAFVPNYRYAGDHLVEQLTPTNRWGKDFITMPLATRSGGDTFRIVAAHDNTDVSINYESVATLDRGQHYETMIEGPATIQGSHPIQVAQYSNGSQVDGVVADPFMMLIPPPEQFLTRYTVATPDYGFERNFLNLVAPDEAVGKIVLDGLAVPSESFVPVGTSGFSGAQVSVGLGSHTLTSDVAFGVTVYGFSDYDSYGYPGGMSLAKVAEIAAVELSPDGAVLPAGTSHQVTASVSNGIGEPLAGVRVDFAVEGANPKQGVAYSDEQGYAHFEYVGATTGSDIIHAAVGDLSATADASWIVFPPSLEIAAPAAQDNFPAGTSVLVTGKATAEMPAELSPWVHQNVITNVRVNGVAVEALDPHGNFFTRVTVSPGTSNFEFETTDTYGQAASAHLTLVGSEAEQASGVNFSDLVDVSTSVVGDYGRTSFYDVKDQLSADVALRNAGSYDVHSPLVVTVAHLSDPTVRVRDFDGVTPNGVPYFLFESEIGASTLAADGLTSPRVISFFNPGRDPFMFELVVLAELNHAPVIHSSPGQTVIVGANYTYAVDASDEDHDSLAFQLLSGPQGLQINTETGVVQWTPGASDKGSHDVRLRVSDGRGGSADQGFLLTVQESGVNTPPVFTSVPPLSARVGEPYDYRASAHDPDDDSLVFDLLQKPEGMVVNGTTGEIVWTPNATQTQPHDVSVSVTDNEGNAATQSFTLLVQDETGNLPPVIVSEPLEHFTSPGTSSAKLGSVTPESIDLSLLLGETTTETVSMQLPSEVGSVPAADVFFLVENSQRYPFRDVAENLPGLIASLQENFPEVDLGFGVAGFSTYSGSPPFVLNQPIVEANSPELFSAMQSALRRTPMSGGGGARTLIEGLYQTATGAGFDGNGDGDTEDSGLAGLGSTQLSPGSSGDVPTIGSFQDDLTPNAFRLLDARTHATKISLDSWVVSTLTPENRTHLYRLSGNAGDELSFEGLSGSATDVEWVLYGPDQTPIFDQALGSSIDVALPASGDFWITVRATEPIDQVDYSFQVVSLNDAIRPLTLGQVVRGDITRSGQAHSYEFHGYSGQRLYFDDLESDFALDTKVTLVSPTGKEVFSQEYLFPYPGLWVGARSPDTWGVEPIALEESGVYRLIVALDGSVGGKYQFRLSEIGTTIETADLDTYVSGSLATPGTADAYRFNGVAGQRLLFQMENTSNDYLLLWRLYDPANQKIFDEVFDQGTEIVTLPADGEYVLDVRSYFLSEYDDIRRDYRFRIVTPDVTSLPLTFDMVVTGELEEPGAIHKHFFTATAGQAVYLNGLEQDPGIEVQLISPSEWELSEWELHSTWGGTDSGIVRLAENGRYEVVVSGSEDATGAYAFRLLDADTVAPLPLDTPVAGTLNAHEAHLFRYEGTAGERLQLQTTGTQPIIRLYGPSGSSVSEHSDVYRLPANGDYYLAFRRLSPSDPDSYSFTVTSQLDDPVPPSGFGSLYAGELAAGELKSFEFTASPGMTIFLDIQTSGTTYRLYDPNGAGLPAGGNRDLDPITLYDSGTYTVTATRSTAGSYQFRLLDLNVDALPITFGQAYNATLSPYTAQAYAIAADVGDRLFFDGLAGSRTPVKLVSPSGVHYVDDHTTGVSDKAGPLPVKESGAFYLVLTNYDSAEEDISFRVLEVSESPLLVAGEVRSGTLDPKNRTDLFRLNGPAGARLIVDEGLGDVYARLYDVGGRRLNLFSPDESFTLPTNATYALAVQASNSNAPTVDYTLQLVFPETTRQDLTLNETLMGKISQAGDAHEFLFTASAGDRFYFDGLDESSWTWCRVRLLSPGGASIFETTRHGTRLDVGPFAVAEDGVYRLIVDGNDTDGSGPYQFRLFSVATAPGLPFDAATTGQISTPAETDIFRFDVTKGQRLHLSHQGSDRYDWRIYGPHNAQVSNGSSTLDGTIEIPEDGTYVLALNASGSDTPTYSFVASLPQTQTSALALGEIVTGTLSESAERHEYTFEGAAAQRLFFDAVALENAKVSMVAPDGATIVNSTANDYGPYILHSPGTFRLVVEGQPGDYAFQLIDLDAAAFVEVDTFIQDDIEWETDIFRVYGLAGQSLLFDGPASHPADWALYGPGNQKLGEQGFLNDLQVTLPADGYYALIISGDATYSQAPTDYAFAIVSQGLEAPPSPGSSLELQLGEITLSAGGDGDPDTFTFTGAAGDVLYFDALEWNTDGSRLVLTSPSGVQLADAPFDADLGPFLLAESGTFRLRLEHSSAMRAAGALGGAGFRQGALPIVVAIAAKGTYYEPDGIDPITGVDGVSVPLSEFSSNASTTTPGGRGASIQPTVDALVDLGAIVVGIGTNTQLYASRRNLEALAKLTGAVNGTDTSIDSGFSDAIQKGDPLYFYPGSGMDGAVVDAITAALQTVPFNVDVVPSRDGAPMENLTGIVSDIIPGGEASFNVEFMGDGSAHDFDLQFVRGGTDVVLGSIPVTINSQGLYLYPVRAFDPDGDELTFHLPVAPGGATIDEKTGLIRWPTPGAGRFNFRVTVDDARGGEASQDFSVNVTFGDPNLPPEITSSHPSQASVGQTLEYRVAANDPNDDPLAYELTVAPDYMEIDESTGSLTWSPTNDQIREHAIEVRVQDGRGGHDTQAFHILVVGEAVNHPPEFNLAPPSQAVPGELYTFDLTATDPDFDLLAYDLPVNPAGMTVSTSGGRVQWVPSQEQVGAQNVTLRVRDGRGGVDLLPFEVDVLSRNSLPVFTSAPPQRAAVGLPLEYRAQAQDADRDDLEFDLIDGPDSVFIDATTGLMSWTPAVGQKGIQPVTIIVSDSRGGSATQSFEIEVLEQTLNEPPEIGSEPVQSTHVGANYRYVVKATDANSDPLQYSVATAPVGMQIDQEGRIHWIPTPDQLGINSVVVQVADGRGEPATQAFDVEVLIQGSNLAPAITSSPPLNTVMGETYVYDAVAQDPDNDPLVWSFQQSPTGMSLNAGTGTIRWTPTLDQVGTVPVTLKVVDGQGGLVTQSFQVDVRPANLPPAITSMPLTVASVGVPYHYAVRGLDGDGDQLTYSLTAAPAGMLIHPTTGLVSWIPGETQLGKQGVAILVEDTYGGASTQVYQIEVTETPQYVPPAFTTTPVVVAPADLLYKYHVEVSDPDDEQVFFSLVEWPEGLLFEDEGPDSVTLAWIPEMTDVGSHRVTIVANDSSGAACTQSFVIKVLDTNAPPEIVSTPLRTATVNDIYRYDVQALDPDNDPLAYSLQSGPDSMTIDGFGRIVWPIPAGAAGTHSVEVSISDGHAAPVSHSFDVEVSADTEAPLVGLWVEKNPVFAGDPVTFVVSVVDNVEVTDLTLALDEVPVPLDSTGRATAVFDTARIVSIVAGASDAAGNSGQQEFELHVIQPSDQEGPLVQLDTPQPDSVLSTVTEVIGTVLDENLDYYIIEVARYPSRDFTPIVQVSETVQADVLGTLDPSLLDNGVYTLRLYAVDQNGQDASVEEPIRIAGDLKLGNFALSFTDLSIPVSGIPITVSRTYDSLRAGQQDEFGYGWRLELSDTDLQTSVPLTGREEDLIYNPIYAGDRVYVTLPGGRREGFTFQPQLASGLRGSFLGLFEPRFVPDPGVYSQLTVEPIELTATRDGALHSFVGSLPYNPVSPTFGGSFLLTTEEGLAYEISGSDGDLTRVSDANGNSLEFTNAGVISSTGKSIIFERDPRGRIQTVVDPLGQRIEYQYDIHGDLVAVTDREGNQTTFVYDEPTRPHFLTEVIDPLGRTGVRSEYDDQGRLVKLIDASGQEVRLLHNPDNFTETVYDQLGNPTTYEYDTLGNIVTEIDPEGGITMRAYEDPDNPTKETSVTNPLGDTTTFTYDSRGNTLTETDPLGNTTTYTYQTFDWGASLVARFTGRASLPFSQQRTVTDPLGNTSTNEYDQSGNLLSMTDSDGNLSSFTYNASGNPLTVSMGDNTTSFTYDAVGNVLEQVDALGTATSFTYDTNGNQLTETVTYAMPMGTATMVTATEYDAEGRSVGTSAWQDGVLLTSTASSYDAVGNRVSETDGLGRVTKFEYDDRGLLTTTIYPDLSPDDDSDNPRTHKQYDAAGHVVSEIDELGRITAYTFDKTGRQTAVIYPDDTPDNDSDNPRSETVYDLSGQVVAEVDPRGNATRFTYDETGNRLETILPDATPGDLSDNPRVVDTYDAAGRRTSSRDPLGNETAFVYSDGGKLQETLFADGTSTNNTFDQQGRLVARTDQNGHVTEYEYDALGRLTAVLQTVAGRELRTQYGYDEQGNLVAQTGANQHTTQYEYDGLGRRIKTILPGGQESTSSYDGAGNVVSTTDFNGQTIEFQYDARDRITRKLLPGDVQVQYVYTPTGQLHQVFDERGETLFAYGAQNRLLSRQEPDGRTIAYAYDVAGNRIQVIIPSGTTTYEYDEQNRLVSVHDPDGDQTSYTYDLAGRLTQTEFANNTAETREYDALSRLLTVETRNTVSDEVLVSYAYELDPAGNRVAVTEHDGRRVAYDYDEIYRLLGETIYDPGATEPSRTIDYTYDEVANRWTRVDSLEGLARYNYDGNDRLLEEIAAGVATSYAYEDNGNLISKTTPTESVFYEWDAENRLIGVDTDADGVNDIAYKYDHNGIRVAQIVNGEETRFLIDANRPYAQVVEEYTSGGILKVSYVHGHDLISQNRVGEGKFFYHVDGLGSTRALTNSSGLVTDRYIYDAFGRTIGQMGSTGNVYLFAGEQRDLATGLDYLRARWMDPSVGRLMSRDTFLGVRRSPLTLNRYIYANANPVNYVDPSGHYSLLELSVVPSVDTNFRVNFAKESLKQIGIIYLGLIPLLGAASRLQDRGLIGIAEEKPGAFGLYTFGRFLQVVAMHRIQKSIVELYKDAWEASLPKLKVSVGGAAGLAAGMRGSLEALMRATQELSRTDKSDEELLIVRERAVKKAVDDFSASWSKTFETSPIPEEQIW